MKKTYFLLVAAVSILIILTVNFVRIPLNSFTNNEYTPDELWNKDVQRKKARKKQGFAKYDKPDMFTKYLKDITTPLGQDKSGYLMNYKIVELNKAISRYKNLKLKKDALNWIERGPANVGGRTRALIVDPDDATHNTWFAGAASGGIWKTTNAGENWTNISDAFTNLSVNSMAMAESDHNVIYAGTGESFPGGSYFYGNGIWKSTDKGNNWTPLASTSTDANFSYVNRLIVDPANANIILAATETGIFKSINGGTSWSKVYSSNFGVEDLVPDPSNFNILFAGEHGIGVLRSTNAGNNWSFSSSGMGPGTRFELAVSPVDHNYVFASVNVSEEVSNVYMSQDNGLNWNKFKDSQAFLSTQGDYDNTIAAHPYIANQVFVGGVDLWKLAFNGTTELSNPELRNAYVENADFLSFVNFGGGFLNGGLSIKDGTNLVSSDWVSVEIRFGPGLSQKAHRFTVPAGATSGVTAANFTYRDYVDVPFQVWDVTNNRQLMVSFRDQEQDGKFNLYKRTGDDYGNMGREYIFVNSVEYNASTPNPNIASNGHHLYKSLFMIWPDLADGASWVPNDLPTSKISIEYGPYTLHKGVKTSIADSYGNFNGPNKYNQSSGYGTTFVPGLHPDHHKIVIIPTGNNNFVFIDANDGGVAISTDNAATFSMRLNRFITTQFYGIAKNPQANEYIGGTQDNGTWQSPRNVDPSNTTNYLFRIGGDGFECLWHAEDPNLILGSVYENDINKSRNRGSTWTSSTNGITDGDGPFITRLSASKENPNLVFAVGNEGIYRSTNFGTSWSKRIIATNWAIDKVVTSNHNVEVSLANGNFVWAGAGMAENTGLQIQLSINGGLNFSAINDYALVDMNANISGIATHPIEDSTAYVLFSLQGKPKVLRTKDLGQSWEDISGFGTNNVSSNGFPDVVVNCLLVMPHDPNTIWVGTDIGLFESTDNGATWHIANNGLPPVSIFDMKIIGHQIVIGTHGRGIWSVDLPVIDNSPYIKAFTHIAEYYLNINTNFIVEYDSVQVFIDGVYNKTLINPAIGINNIEVTTSHSGLNVAFIKAYVADAPYKSNTIYLNLTPTSVKEMSKESKNLMKIYPNPSNGNFKIYLKERYKETKVWIFSLNGKIVYTNRFSNLDEIKIEQGKLSPGTYILNVYSGNVYETKPLIIQ
jgi:photosystem II stability/assembly factor-like uncharacterized protein